MKYVLKDPITIDGDTITELNFRERIRAGDLRSLPADPAAMNNGHFITLAGKLCGKPDLIMNELGLEDFQEVATLVGNFMSGGPKTGATVSA